MPAELSLEEIFPELTDCMTQKQEASSHMLSLLCDRFLDMERNLKQNYVEVEKYQALAARLEQMENSVKEKLDHLEKETQKVQEMPTMYDIMRNVKEYCTGMEDGMHRKTGIKLNEMEIKLNELGKRVDSKDERFDSRIVNVESKIKQYDAMKQPEPEIEQIEAKIMENIDEKFEFFSKMKMDLTEMSKEIAKVDQKVEDAQVGIQLIAAKLEEEDDDDEEVEESFEFEKSAIEQQLMPKIQNPQIEKIEIIETVNSPVVIESHETKIVVNVPETRVEDEIIVDQVPETKLVESEEQIDDDTNVDEVTEVVVEHEVATDAEEPQDHEDIQTAESIVEVEQIVAEPPVMINESSATNILPITEDIEIVSKPEKTSPVAVATKELDKSSATSILPITEDIEIVSKPEKSSPVAVASKELDESSATNILPITEDIEIVSKPEKSSPVAVATMKLEINASPSVSQQLGSVPEETTNPVLEKRRPTKMTELPAIPTQNRRSSSPAAGIRRGDCTSPRSIRRKTIKPFIPNPQLARERWLKAYKNVLIRKRLEAALGKSSLFSNRNESIGQRVKRLERSIDAVAEDLKNAVMCIEGAMQARDERIKSELKGNIQDTETRMKEQMKSKFVALGNELKKTADKLQKGFDSSLNDDRQLSEARFELLEFLCRSIASYPTLDTSLTEYMCERLLLCSDNIDNTVVQIEQWNINELSPYLSAVQQSVDKLRRARSDSPHLLDLVATAYDACLSLWSALERLTPENIKESCIYALRRYLILMSGLKFLLTANVSNTGITTRLDSLQSKMGSNQVDIETSNERINQLSLQVSEMDIKVNYVVDEAQEMISETELRRTVKTLSQEADAKNKVLQNQVGKLTEQSSHQREALETQLSAMQHALGTLVTSSEMLDISNGLRKDLETVKEASSSDDRWQSLLRSVDSKLRYKLENKDVERIIRAKLAALDTPSLNDDSSLVTVHPALCLSCNRKTAVKTTKENPSEKKKPYIPFSTSSRRHVGQHQYRILKGAQERYKK